MAAEIRLFNSSQLPKFSELLVSHLENGTLIIYQEDRKMKSNKFTMTNKAPGRCTGGMLQIGPLPSPSLHPLLSTLPSLFGAARPAPAPLLPQAPGSLPVLKPQQISLSKLLTFSPNRLVNSQDPKSLQLTLKKQTKFNNIPIF